MGIFLVLPDLRMPALTSFIDGSGPVVAGKVFPFCFITIACGAISGFHTLIASGTTPKIMTRETHARPIGYGAMCLESLVAIMALIAACTLDPGVYLSINIKGEPAATVARATALNFPVTMDQMNGLAAQVHEKSLFGRTGGAATLAVGMAKIFSRAVSDRGLDLWYHFAIMFEALFILTTLDAGTRVGRYLLQDVLGALWKPLADTRDLRANFLASALVVTGWGYFLIQGVNDPLGGINSLWPLFGIANQMLAAIALCLGTTVLLKMGLRPTSGGIVPVRARPALALVTLIPLLWLLSATVTAGVQKIFHSDPRIGFLSQAKALGAKLPSLEQAQDSQVARQRIAGAHSPESVASAAAAEKALHDARIGRFNNLLDAAVAAAFLLMVGAIVILSFREWFALLTGRKPSILHETAPAWLPDYEVAEGNPLPAAGTVALAIALARELSGESHFERARLAQAECACVEESGATRAAGETKLDGRTYEEVTTRRFNGVRRCC
jgi:carbon starvation protein